MLRDTLLPGELRFGCLLRLRWCCATDSSNGMAAHKHPSNRLMPQLMLRVQHLWQLLDQGFGIHQIVLHVGSSTIS